MSLFCTVCGNEAKSETDRILIISWSKTGCKLFANKIKKLTDKYQQGFEVFICSD